MTGPHVAVVGGGITGLVAASQLADAGIRVTVLESAPTVGGQIRSVRVAGRVVDVGAESLHTATPAAPALLARLHLDEDVVDARRGPTWIATPRGLRRLPDGVGPAGPTKLRPVVTAGILSPAGLLRAACEPFARAGHPGQDLSVGSYLTRRFGPQLTDRLVDPLLGNLHAGDVHRLSLAAAVPQLDRTARQHRSLVLGRRHRSGAGPPPRFVTVAGGLGRIPGALAADPRIEVRTSAEVQQLAPSGAGYRLTPATGAPVDADAVILAVPASVAAGLLAPLDLDVSRHLERIRSASVATVIVDYPTVGGSPRLEGNGVLVPSSAGRLLKAATFLTNKWPHLADDDRFLVRLSVGRADDGRLADLEDDQLVAALHADLSELTGLDVEPREATVHRWPETMPQLEVGHNERIATVRRRLAGRQRIALAGASFDGVGITACLRSAADAARAVLASVDRTLEVGP